MGIDEVRKGKLLAERRAKARPLVRMARAVAKELGVAQNKKHGAWHTFNDEDKKLVVEYDDYGDNLHIIFNSVRVLDVHLGSVIGYVPGERWETILRQRHAEAAVPIAKRDREKEKKEQAQLEKRWGIKAGDLHGR